MSEFQYVPIEPTHEMLSALTGEWHSSRFGSASERYKAMLAAAPKRTDGWQPIATAPKDGTQFQAYLGHWEPLCRINPESGALEIYGRVDYDIDGWAVYSHLTVTHWMPLPSPPGESP